MVSISSGQATAKPQIEVAAAIILDQGKILISQRDEKSHLSGYWEFPGGKREANESFEDCVLREIREELNVDIEVEQYFETVRYEYAEKIVSLKFYRCRYLQGEARALGCRQFKWVPLNDLANYLFPPANDPIVRRLLQTRAPREDVMPSTITVRPAAEEYAPFYAAYVARLPDQELLGLLSSQLEQTCGLLGSVSEPGGAARYAPDKWSIKEVVGHIADTERIMSYRFLRVARGDATPLPGFEQDDYVRAAGFNQRTLISLIDEFRQVRAATLSLVRATDETALSRRGMANGCKVSARALAYIIAGHERHHTDMLRERYQLGRKATSGSQA